MMLKYLLLPLIVAGALLVPTKPAAAYRGYGYRGPRPYVRPYYRPYYYGPRAYVAPRVIVRPTYNRAPVYVAPGGYYGTGYYQPNTYYPTYGW
ncbi:hypothetical protein [Schlesneria paludicola]|uniref:hypothetical protein n=1 Tax=Schlesneria paludicola TaxID=360056 RepID=UPI00029A8EAE|nr:hypothetical protein [Schlesneria paludicola]